VEITGPIFIEFGAFKLMNLGFLNDDSIFLKPTPWPKLKKRIDKLLERHDRFIVRVERQKDKSAAKVRAEQHTSINNQKIFQLKPQ
jgi:hypothetical protein